MPNYSFNTITIKGKKKDILGWLNTRVECSKKLTSRMPFEKMIGILSGEGITLDSFNPMPATYNEWDTTNNMHDFISWLDGGYNKNVKYSPLLNGQEVYRKIREQFGEESYTRDDEMNVAKQLYPEYAKDYEKYCEEWKAAKKYQQETYGVVGWYDWGLKYRGTKWNTKLEKWHFEEVPDTNEIIVSFYCETAWSYPDAWLKKQQKDNRKKLLFFCRASEESGAYNGYFAVWEDEWVEDHQYLWSVCQDLIKQEKGDDFDEDDDYEEVVELEMQKDDEINSRYFAFVREYIG